ncbi:25S rRNA (adenine645-N1)-methyltransferase [Emydomyces testavorans]|uniref:Ribosomal RNA-processing protein 8 n=1 Tax=Emydomyces testavorans TaxID=2070801 RepID=A0AAF0DIY9_9EURO|nr:25S rRNA (adenine645-N1)-methyltransferase [Emydomyces testavorans]
MFPVPGWSVSTTELKLQTEPTPVSHQHPTENDRQDSASKSKKRKRTHGVDDKVTKANVDEMWRKHIEGSGPKKKTGGNLKSKKEKKKDKKLVKQENDIVESTNQIHTFSTRPNKEKLKSTKRNALSEKKDGSSRSLEFSQKKQKLEKLVGISKDTQKPTSTSLSLPPASANLTPLQKTMRDKLVSARFRHLNETLYTTPSIQALELFTANPELFAEYHAGFSRQVKESWPSNPVDDYIRSVKIRGLARSPAKRREKPDHAANPTPLPRRPSGLCTIADLGCGDAQFAHALAHLSKKMKLKILSYDLHEGDPLITKADISSLPLQDGTVDITIFCLSLMGTNWVSFVEEAWRVLRGDGKGECWVSEVKSRFGKVVRKSKQLSTPAARDNNKATKKRKNAGEDEDELGEELFAEDIRTTGADDGETDISAFVEVFRTRGFILKPQSVDKSNKMFVKMEFVKHGVPTKGKWVATGGVGKGSKKRFLEPESSGLTPEEESEVLKPCVYKIR